MTLLLCGFLLLAGVPTLSQSTDRAIPGKPELLLLADEWFKIAAAHEAGNANAENDEDPRAASNADIPALETDRRAVESIAPWESIKLTRESPPGITFSPDINMYPWGTRHEHISLPSGSWKSSFNAGGAPQKQLSRPGRSPGKTQSSPTACPGLGRDDFTGHCGTLPAFNFSLWQSHSTDRHSADTATHAVNSATTESAGIPKESFHWGPALWQSLAFLVLEHTFRVADDPEARYMLFHRPFWHDYFASLTQFHNQWGDGDDFIVNYIGHPLQGSISGNIFIQNDPKGRGAKFGKSSVYWMSRLKAMAWAAAYSTYFELGPGLSETAIGNQGGYTYIPNCGYYPTCKKKPGRHYKPPTNNTGYVDLVVTPTIGFGWMILEDSIERKIVDPVAKGRQTLKFNILRGTLAPSRSMSNLLAGRLPWYRPSDDKAALDKMGTLVRSTGNRAAWKDQPRWDLAVQVINLNLPKPRKGCMDCRDFSPGAGVELGYRLARYLYLSSEFNLFPGAGAGSEKRPAMEGLLGVKVGRSVHSWQLSAVGRPGFIRYDKGTLVGASIDYESTMRFVWDFGGSVDYKTSPSSAVRFKLGTNIVRWPTHPDVHQPPVTVLSDDYVVAQGSFYFTGGYVFRF